MWRMNTHADAGGSIAPSSFIKLLVNHSKLAGLHIM